MKTLRKLAAVLPLVLMMNCNWNNLFNQKLPDKIIPNTSNPPVSILSVTPQSGYAPLTANISDSATSLDGKKITNYSIWVDIDEDGTIDETISQSNPINVSRIFNEGKVRIFEQCEDESGSKSNRKNLEIIISKLAENKLPNATLSVSPTSGQYPLATNISLNGTDSDGIVANYNLEIRINDKVDTSISQSTPINIPKIFDDVENATITGTVTDDKGGQTIKSVNVNATERNDLTANIGFSSSYHTGNNFNFFAEIQNVTAGDLTITNNSTKRSLEYKVVKDDGTIVLEKKSEDDMLIKLHEMGKIKLDYLDNKVTFTLTNAYISALLLT